MITKTVQHSDEYPDQTWCIHFKNKGASANIAIMGDEPDTAYLYDLFSTNRRNGEASKLIKEIDAYCLTNHITLIIYANVYESGESGIKTNDELKKWYEKNGAHYIGMSDENDDTPMLLLGYDSDQSE